MNIFKKIFGKRNEKTLEEEYLNEYKKTKPKEYTTAKEPKYITVNDIAIHFKVTSKEVNNLLFKFNYIEKRENWTVATGKGFIFGAEERYSVKTKQKYVVWDEEILENAQLNEVFKKREETKPEIKITSYQEKIDKGKEFEEYVAKVYRSRGYHVTEFGKLKGREDKGIDLIAKKEKELILIQGEFA